MAFGDKYRKEKTAIETKEHAKAPDTLPSAIKASVNEELSENEAKNLRQQARIKAFNTAVKNKIKEKEESDDSTENESPKQKVENDRVKNFLKNMKTPNKMEKKKRKGLLGIEYDKVLFSFAKIRVMKTWDYYDQSNVCMQVQCFCLEYHFDITDDEIIELVQRAYKEVKGQADRHVPFKD